MGTVVSGAKRPKLVGENMVALYDALLSLKTREECVAFLRDLCTIAELKELGERFAIARLVAKEMTYREVSEKTGASSATITRVAHWLNHGTGGYRTAIARMKR